MEGDSAVTIVRVCDIERALAKAYPPEWAEEWDRVGLLAGDPQREVTGVTLALDPTPSVLASAISRGDNVLLTHHPAFLKTPQWLTPGPGPSGVVFSALQGGVALINAHTNLDRAPAAGALLPQMLDLEPVKPIERSLQQMTVITVFAPESHADRIAAAMAGAGAGRVGEYEAAHFVSGVGRGGYRAGGSTSPALGHPGEVSSAEEVRIEMVAPRNKTRAVVQAARGAHLYEEPLITAVDVQIARSAARMGMLSQAAEPLTLSALAQRAAEAFGVTPRVWGDPNVTIERIATATGSGGSLVGDAKASGADVLVAGEVRYHDALGAADSGLSVIEVGHDASEWPLVNLLGDAILSLPDLDPAIVHALPATVGWWTPQG
jgi:dinuclear metal center YbgI/SA1388 family protein